MGNLPFTKFEAFTNWHRVLLTCVFPFNISTAQYQIPTQCSTWLGNGGKAICGFKDFFE